MGGIGLLIADFTLAFLWVWSGVLVKILVFHVLGFHHDATGEIVKMGFSVLNLFLFAYLMNNAKGAAYNPLTILSSALSGDFSKFLFTVGARIPAQVLGAIYAVRLLVRTFPDIGRGPKLNVELHKGALTEGFLAFAIVFISLTLKRTLPGSFVRKTWISSLCKLTLQILGADLTGGSMNPASATGWAFVRGDYKTKEHILVYWLGPIEGTLLAVWLFKLLFGSESKQKEEVKAKSE